MLIVSANFEFVPGGFERVKDSIIEAVTHSRKEAGAQTYDWTLDVTNPNHATIFEIWDNQESLDQHFTYPYMDTLVEALSEASLRGDIISYSAHIYDVSGKRDMGFELPSPV